MRRLLCVLALVLPGSALADVYGWCSGSAADLSVRSSTALATAHLIVGCLNSALCGNPSGVVTYYFTGVSGSGDSWTVTYNDQYGTPGSTAFARCSGDCDFELANSITTPGLRDGERVRGGLGEFPPAGSEWCDTISQCKLVLGGPVVSLGSSWVASVVPVDDSCDTLEDELPGAASSGRCMSGSGVTACSSQPESPPVAESQTASVNGDVVPPAGLQSGQCAIYASGGSACVVDTGDPVESPPAPDNGTPGEPATPTVSVSNTVNNTTANYYSPSTTSGSSGVVTGAPGSSSGGLDGSGDDDEGGEDEEFTGPETDEVCTFGDCAQEFFNRVQDAPLVASVIGAGASMPAGSCPSWGITAFGDTNSLSAPMCAIWDEVAPMLSAAFLVFWAWVATRIVLSA